MEYTDENKRKTNLTEYRVGELNKSMEKLTKEVREAVKCLNVTNTGLKLAVQKLDTHIESAKEDRIKLDKHDITLYGEEDKSGIVAKVNEFDKFIEKAQKISFFLFTTIGGLIIYEIVAHFIKGQ